MTPTGTSQSPSVVGTGDPVTAPAVWFAQIDRSLLTNSALTTLSSQEQARMRRYRSRSAAERFVARRIVARRIIAAQAGCLPEEVAMAQHCSGCHGTDHGRPVANGMPLSLSSSGNIVMIATSTVGPLGADVELMSPRSPTVPLWICHPKERQEYAQTTPDNQHSSLLRTWVAKEAYAKALGLGFRLPFASVFLQRHGRTFIAKAPNHPEMHVHQVAGPKALGPVTAMVATTSPVVHAPREWHGDP